MHPAIVKTSQLILAGDIIGAENELTEIAEQEGDFALVKVLDDVPPRDLLALMREYDSSKESVINLLVTPEQFAKAVVLEIQYGERNNEKLRGMMNSVIHRDADTACEYLETIALTEGGIGVLADYFDDRHDELFSFSSSGHFTVHFNAESNANLHTAWLMEKIEELDHGLVFGNSIKDQRPAVSREEVAEGDWMETAWILRYELSDAFEELMIMIRNRAQKGLELAVEAGVSTPAGSARTAADEGEEAAI
jgi:hypothetical protein